MLCAGAKKTHRENENTQNFSPCLLANGAEKLNLWYCSWNNVRSLVYSSLTDFTVVFVCVPIISVIFNRLAKRNKTEQDRIEKKTERLFINKRNRKQKKRYMWEYDEIALCSSINFQNVHIVSGWGCKTKLLSVNNLSQMLVQNIQIAENQLKNSEKLVVQSNERKKKKTKRKQQQQANKRTINKVSTN